MGVRGAHRHRRSPELEPKEVEGRKGVKNHFSRPRMPVRGLNPYEAVYAAAQLENGKAWGAREAPRGTAGDTRTVMPKGLAKLDIWRKGCVNHQTF